MLASRCRMSLAHVRMQVKAMIATRGTTLDTPRPSHTTTLTSVSPQLLAPPLPSLSLLLLEVPRHHTGNGGGGRMRGRASRRSSCFATKSLVSHSELTGKPGVNLH